MIVFESVTFQNFLSVGNTPVTINLNDAKTKLIHGTNGSGKSLVLDCITYALFAKPHRKINLPQLLNSQNKKGLLVEINFSIGRNSYRVVRGIKPKVFEIYVNGNELDKTAADKDNQAYLESNILKMNHKTFSQVVILGTSNFVPFMQLGNLARRECVEDFLDIKVFSTMSVMSKERLRGLREQLKDTEKDISVVEYKVDMQKDRIDELHSQSKSDIGEWLKIIESTKTTLDSNEKQSEFHKNRDSIWMKELNDLLSKNPQDKYNNFNKVIIKMEGKGERLSADIDFFNKHTDCPTCGQEIDESVKQKRLSDTKEEAKKIFEAVKQAVSLRSENKSILDQINEWELKLQKNNQQIFKLNTEKDSLLSTIHQAETQIANIKDNTSKTDKEEGKYQALREQYDLLVDKRNKLLHTVKDHEVVVDLLKDSGIKTQVVRKYLPVMNKFIRTYLTHLDFPVHFKLDEQFNESVATPMYQDFSYASFSEGQKARIDLALLFVWREIGRLKNSVSTNILFLDEVFSSSLDDAGKDNLMALIRYRLPENQRVIVVDHTLSQGFQEKFDKRIEVSRIKGFSHYSS